MFTSLRPIAHALLFGIGFAIIILGIVLDEKGAVPIGLIVAAVNLQQLLQIHQQKAFREPGAPKE